MAVEMIGGPRLCEPLLAMGVASGGGVAAAAAAAAPKA
jgi:hypothetical protein